MIKDFIISYKARGNGKTTELINKVVECKLNSGVAQIVVLTSSESEARELCEKYKKEYIKQCPKDSYKLNDIGKDIIFSANLERVFVKDAWWNGEEMEQWQVFLDNIDLKGHSEIIDELIKSEKISCDVWGTSTRFVIWERLKER